MVMQRLRNDAFGRMMHQRIYDYIKRFCEEHTPELPADPVVKAWLSRLYEDDLTIHILVRLDDNYNIIGHAVIDVQESYGYRAVICHQVSNVSNKIDNILEGGEYIDKLVVEVNAICSIITVIKHSKALEKKLNYKVARTVMIKGANSAELDSE